MVKDAKSENNNNNNNKKKKKKNSTTEKARVLTDGFLLLRNFSVAISISPHVCFILVLILISRFLR